MEVMASRGGRSGRDRVTVLWHGWLKRMSGFSKRWRRRYFVFLSTAAGMKELRHYDAPRELTALLASTPKGVIAMTDATGICCFLTPSMLTSASSTSSAATSPVASARKHSGSHVHMLAFQSGQEWGSASESQQGLALLASLSAFYPAVDVQHTGYLAKKREGTMHTGTTTSMISRWKRHYFVYLSTGDLLYFRDDSLHELQGRIDVRHAPTVRVTGERMLEEQKKDLANVLKFARHSSAANVRENCLVWIATPPSKMFVLKLQDDREGRSADGRRYELTTTAKKWLSLLQQGHAETKYTQLEQCIAVGKYEPKPEIVSAIRAGIPDELRGQLWFGFSGAVVDIQRRQADLKQANRMASKPVSVRGGLSSREAIAMLSEGDSLYGELSAPLDANAFYSKSAEQRMIFSRLCAVGIRDARLNNLQVGFKGIQRHAHSLSNASSIAERVSIAESLGSIVTDRTAEDDIDSGNEYSDSESAEHTPSSADLSPPTKRAQSLKLVSRGRMGHYVYPSEAQAPEWEVTARRRLLIASARFNPYSHPCPWRVSCLLLAYMDEENAFWLINRILDVYLPGYFHGYRPALQIDAAAFSWVLKERAPALLAHLQSVNFPLHRAVERWFMSLFTSTDIPLPTVLRIWDAFFVHGVRIFFGVGVALFLRAEEQLYDTKNSVEALETLRATERSSIDADALFSHAFKDDLNMLWLSEDHFHKVRSAHRRQVMEEVSEHVDRYNELLDISSQLQDQFSICLSSVQNIMTQSGLRQPFSTFSPGKAASKEAEKPVYEDEDSLECSLDMLRATIEVGTDAVNSLVRELTPCQARWVALSSQLSACPLSRGMSSDLKSWLSQVKEGKISGAGHDAESCDRDEENFNIGSTAARSGLFFEADDEEVDAIGNDVSYSFLMGIRKDFAVGPRFHAEGFLYSLATVMKAASATRFELIAAAHRCTWHASRWLHSPIEFASSTANDSRSSEAHALRRSASTTSKISQSGRKSSTPSTMARRKTQTVDDSALNTRSATSTTWKDSGSNNLSRSYVNPSRARQRLRSVQETTASPPSRTPRFDDDLSQLLLQSPYAPMTQHSVNQHQHISQHASTGSPSSAYSGWTNLQDALSTQSLSVAAYNYQQNERALHSAVGVMLTCFQRFRQLERYVIRSPKDHHDRGAFLESDLVHELGIVNEQVRSSLALY